MYLAGLTLLRAVTQPGVIAPRECASLAADLAPLLIEKVGPSLARCICHTSYSKMCMKDLGEMGGLGAVYALPSVLLRLTEIDSPGSRQHLILSAAQPIFNKFARHKGYFPAPLPSLAVPVIAAQITRSDHGNQNGHKSSRGPNQTGNSLPTVGMYSCFPDLGTANILGLGSGLYIFIKRALSPKNICRLGRIMRASRRPRWRRCWRLRS